MIYGKETTTINKIYCDMDGVLTDLRLHYRNCFKVDVDKIISDEDFFARTAKDPLFWFNIPWMPGGEILWKFLTSLERKSDIINFILSRPAPEHLDPNCYLGKIKWCRDNLNLLDVAIILESTKEKYAGPDALLIDDLKSNIDKWTDKGGIGIHHVDPVMTIYYLTHLISNKQIRLLGEEESERYPV